MNTNTSISSTHTKTDDASNASGATDASNHTPESQSSSNRHLRFQCPMTPFLNNSKIGGGSINDFHCPDCLCFICGVKVSECGKWDGLHCHARWVLFLFYFLFFECTFMSTGTTYSYTNSCRSIILKSFILFIDCRACMLIYSQ